MRLYSEKCTPISRSPIPGLQGGMTTITSNPAKSAGVIVECLPRDNAVFYMRFGKVKAAYTPRVFSIPGRVCKITICTRKMAFSPYYGRLHTSRVYQFEGYKKPRKFDASHTKQCRNNCAFCHLRNHERSRHPHVCRQNGRVVRAPTLTTK